MIDQMNKKELKDQLKANEIAIPLEADEQFLRELLAKAIEEGKAELKDLGASSEESEKENEGEGETEKEFLNTGVPGIDGEQMTTLQCMLFMQGKPFREVKEEKASETEKGKKSKGKK